MITNCNCAIELDCGCSVSFDSYSDNLYSALAVGNLIGRECTLEAYVIDWYRDGVPAMTSGKNIPGLDAYHPFTGGAAIPVQAGVWTPVLRFAVIAGEMVYSRPAACRPWCRDLQGGLPSITVRALGCDIVSGGAPSGYTFRIGYKTSQDYSYATHSIRWDLPADGSMKYLALQFTTYLVPDLVQVFYNDESQPLSQYWVGQDLSGMRGDVEPNQVDLQSLKLVANFEERTYHPGDYLIIRITPSSNPNTEWILDLKCLNEGAFEGNCGFFPVSLRDIDPDSLTMVYDAVNCRYLLTFAQDVLSSSFALSNLNRYNTIMTNSSSNDSTFNSNTGMGQLILWDKVYCTGEALHTHYHVNSAGLISYAKTGNQFTFEFEHADDYSAFKAWYNGNRTNWKFSSFNQDPTHINHYKIHSIHWREVATQCGDVHIPRGIYFHWLSPVTFNDTQRTMSIEFYDIRNQYPNEQPRQRCSNTWDQISTWVNACQSTRTAQDWSGTTRCREGRPCNGVWIYEQIWNDLDKVFHWMYSYAVKSLDNVCRTPGWAQSQVYAWRWEFLRWYLRVEVTDPGDRARNFRIFSGISRETGERTGTWERIFEMQDGIRIYP